MKGRLILAFILLQFFNIVSAQVYHYETGKVISSNEPGVFNFKEGVFNSYPAEYYVLLAKENNLNKRSRLISIPVIRIKSISTDSLSYPIFILYGGPGESNLKSDLIIDRLLSHHDIVLVGYRGVDGEIKLDCPCIKETLLSDSLRLNSSENYFTRALDTCFSDLRSKNIDINGYSINEVVNDINLVREEFEYDSISFIAFSFGTIIAQQYAHSYEEHTKNMVLLGARPLDNMVIDGDVLNEQLYKFHKYYSGTIEKKAPNEKELFLTDMYQEILNINDTFNLQRFLIFSFSQLYTLNKIEDFLVASKNATNDDYDRLFSYYNEFYSNYPGDVILGDIFLKKQKQIYFDKKESTQESNIGGLIANGVNNWYSPYHSILQAKEKLKIDTLNVPILFISGELDVASPPQLLNEIKPFYSQSEYIELDRTGHLDFFFEKKQKVDSLIRDFYSSFRLRSMN